MTTRICRGCKKVFQPKRANGKPQIFCEPECKKSFEQKARTVGTSVLDKRQNRKPRADRKTQRLIDLDGIPASEQAELLANMALEVGTSDGPTVTAARYAAKAIAICRERGLPFKSRQECRGLIRATSDPMHRAKLEAMFDVMETEKCFA